MYTKLIPYRAILALLSCCSIGISYGGATDSTDPRLLGNPDTAKIFLLEQGYIDWPADPTSEQQVFATAKHCPTNFKPYAVIRLSKVRHNGPEVVQGFGACVNGVGNSADGEHHMVGYLLARKYSTINSRNNGLVLYGSTNPGCFTGAWPCYTAPIPPSAAMGPSQQDFGQIGGFYWDLYCYPPNTQPPAIDPGACFGGGGNNPY
ncbi:MAG: hypothetical protein JO149_05940 [Gammaproteobacteria bacterium]|nr:hypothetical protein [Gammaproteobacteria bacterium]